MSEAIPGPPGLPFLGNIGDITPRDSASSLRRLADTYGMPAPITALTR
jgi:cytochrome P450/NADPH-cytochrome P450 reductase